MAFSLPDFRTVSSARPASRWRWVLTSVLLVLTPALCAPVLYMMTLPYVPALRTTNPLRTPLMELREKQARAQGKELHTTYLWKDLSEISPHLAHAVLLSEDDMFYQHHGFDMEQIQAAIKTDWEKKRFAYGGSTISQQLARSLYLSPKKNLFRKAKEALLTVLLERYLTKKRMMEIYLNVIEWGRGIYGAEAASQAYFQKSAKDLTPDEAVALASILPSPRRWNPASERAFMARRRTRLYARMLHAGYVPEDQVTGVPDEISQMAAAANRLLLQQEAEENPLQIPVDDSRSEEGLYMPGHSPAPSPAPGPDLPAPSPPTTP